MIVNSLLQASVVVSFIKGISCFQGSFSPKCQKLFEPEEPLEKL